MHKKFIGLKVHDNLGATHERSCQTYSIANGWLDYYDSKYGAGAFNLKYIIGYNEVWDNKIDEPIKCVNCQHYRTIYLSSLSDTLILNEECKLHSENFNNQTDKLHQCDDYLAIGEGRI